MIQKQPVSINFSQGLDTKTDPYQVQIGKFLSLTNSVFNKGGQLQKRNGYGGLASMPAVNYLTTFGGNLTGIGSNLQALSRASDAPINKGSFQALSLSTLPMVRSALNQTQCDSVVAPNGLVCTVYTETNNASFFYKYSIQDSITGQNIVNPTAIPVASGVVTGSPRVFLLGNYFVIVFTNVISTVSHLQYIAISTNTAQIFVTNTDIVAAYIPPGSGSNLNWDGVVVPGTNRLYIAFNATNGGQHVGITFLSTYFNSSFVTPPTPTVFASSVATLMSICADITNASSPVIYASFYDSNTSTGNVVAVDQNLAKLMTATQIISSTVVYNITCSAQNGVVTSIYEVQNQYSYDSAIESNFLNSVPVILPATVTTGSVGSTATGFIRSIGLASKSFIFNGKIYVLGEYASALQSTYFLFDLNANIVSRFAYENGGASLVITAGYLPSGLPQAQVVGTNVNISYLFKDLIQSQNTLGLVQSIGPAGKSNIYSQTGVNLALIGFDSSTLSTSEIGLNLNLSGGMLWAYDGQTLQEQGFSVFPDNVEATWSTTGGSIVAQPDGSTNTNAYWYQTLYEWTDAQGNIFRSSPSVPIPVTTTGSGTSGSITVNIPTLRLSYKTGIKIIIYRWSVAQQVYYQVTSVTAPTLNNPAVDSIAYVDTLSDARILGNSIIYTTGGVVEDIAGPAATATALFDDRLWLIDAEDKNLLWYSKQVIQSTPVEMSDLFTIYVAPSTGAQGSTGNLRCLFPMDDKLILFKNDAIYYINGTGPDNTGANSQYSQPIFVNSTVGCANQNSIVFMPNGLMFQSDKGIWLLGRDLSTTYIGAPVEAFNQYTVNSAQNIPGTNQVRFTLSNGVTLTYDYFYDQWSVFEGIPAISSTLYQGLHTSIDSNGFVSQETPGQYLDNGNPVLLSFTTSWVNLAGLQGYQRVYFFYLLGTYLTPHKLNLQIAYDYNSSPSQSTPISPTNFSSAVPSPYGSPPAPFGSPSNIESWRVFFTKQRCTSFQITLNEIYDPSFGVPAGQGLTLSGLNMVVGIKKGWRTQSAAHSAGGGTNST